MFSPDNLDPREQEVYDNADEFWATRFAGRGQYVKLGPFSSQLAVVRGVAEFFENETRDYPPPASIVNRPFAIYAASSKHGGAHVVLGTLGRDGKRGITQREVSLRKQEERVQARRNSNRRNTQRPPEV